MQKKKVVIIGMGFGGLRAARHLEGEGFEILALDRRNFHLFQPLLYQVATAMLEQESIAYSLRAITRKWKDTNFEMSEVLNIDLDNRKIHTAARELPYDYLVIAAGSVTNFFNNEAIQKNAFDLKQLDDAVALRNHILSVYEEAVKETDAAKRAALMTFVVVGGGPTGVEFSGALAELTQSILTKDYPNLDVKSSKIILVEAHECVLGTFPRKLQKYAERRLRRMGVQIRFSSYVTDATPDTVSLKDGSQIPARTLFWAAGVRSAPLADAIQAPKAKAGRVIVQPDLTIANHPEVFVIGDMAYLEQNGEALPMVAPVAMQGGEYVADAIIKRNRGEVVAPFRYFDKGSMAVIGRGSAVAAAFGIGIQGFFAWLAWLGLHLFYLVGFRNRIMTLLNWGYEFLFYDRQVRLITKNDVEKEKTLEA